MESNNAGGFSFVLDKWKALDRFLILGAEGGTFYVRENDLVKQNHDNVVACIKEDGVRVVKVAAEISESGRAHKNDPAIFVLALVFTHGDLEAKKAAEAALTKICRTGTHLLTFVTYVNTMRGWSRQLRRSVANWYNTQKAKDLAYQVVKYQSRGGMSHHDVLHLAHAKPSSDEHNRVMAWAKTGKLGETTPSDLRILEGFEKAKVTTDAKDLVKLIADYGLTHEMVPTNLLNEPKVWEALLAKMPLTAMVRNLGKMSAIGLLAPLSDASKLVVDRLGNEDFIKKSRLHPLAVLFALKTYASGQGFRGSNTWKTVPAVVDALDEAFYLAFGNVEPTGKRQILALDVSGSMFGAVIANSNLTAGEAAAALALVTARVEKDYHMLAFSHTLVDLNISPKMRLDTVCATMRKISFGGTDCAQPMLWASKNAVKGVDAFSVYTDNETWAGNIQPTQALRDYRNRYNAKAKLAVVGMTATKFTIADPKDAGMLDVVGMDGSTPALLSEFVRG
jgi:60 kDa SS-A/Ro ribonucleoprotein